MKKTFVLFLLRAPVAIKEFGDLRKWRLMSEFGKSLHNIAIANIKIGWLM